MMNLLSVWLNPKRSVNSDEILSVEGSYEPLFSKSPDAIFVMNQYGQVISVNRSFQELLGYQAKESNNTKRNGLAGLDEDRVRPHLHKALNGFSSSFAYEFIDKSGRTVPVNITLIPSISNVCEAGDEGEKLIFGICKELIGQKEYSSKINTLSVQLEQVQRISKTGIWNYDARTQEVTWTKQTYSIFGVDERTFQLTLDNIFAMLHPDDGKICERMFFNAIVTGTPFSLEYRLMLENGVERTVFQTAETVLDQTGKLIRIIGIIRDITEEKKHQEMLDFIANHDFLTKLPNRTYFDRKLNEYISETLEEGGQFAVFYLDLDRLNSINETLGYHIGDQLLIAFSKRLLQILPANTFLARIGGDEFALCIETVEDVEDTLPIASRIISEMQMPFYIDDYELFITTSIGISCYPFDGADPLTLLKNARQALKKVKEKGSNDWHIYSASLNIESFKIYQLERDLRKALINQEFYLVYQPKVNTRTGRIEGAEALIRWKHPDWGVVSPGEFIPLAEENGAVLAMGDWVLQEVCETLSTWIREGHPVVPVSVNISPRRLLRSDFVQNVQDTIHAAGIDPSLIEFELTEYVIIQNTEMTKKVISQLKSFGIRFALDDFGTGYSSLSYLMDLDIDALKIDKSFIDGIGLNKANEGIVKSALFLANELGIRAVAEGVEEHHQVKFLLQQGCLQIQGYYFSKPVETAVFKKQLQYGVLKRKRNTKLTKPVENRRKYYRLPFAEPLSTEMTIIRFNNHDIKLGKSKSLIEDISLGGLRYLSEIQLPVQKSLIIQFTAVILEQKVQFTGYNVWRKEVNGYYQYGLELIITEKEREKLAPLINQLRVTVTSRDLSNN